MMYKLDVLVVQTVCAFSSIVAVFGTYNASSFSTYRQSVLDKVFNGYDPRISPNFEDNSATAITVQIYIVSIDSIQESSMDFKVDIFFRQSWNDSRLMYPKLADVRFLEIDVRRMHEIWVPDSFFINEKRGHFHDITIPNKLMHLYPDGKVYYSMRLALTLSCFMHLQKYPFDDQKCPITLESYGFTTDNLVFQWAEEPLLKPEDLRLPQFEWHGFDTLDCTKIYGDSNFTCIQVDIELSRNYGYFITQVYVPSVMVVILSWVSFWLDIDAIPARISLGLLTVLTMTTQSSGARASLPRVSYVKAIDVYMATCLFFVFAALIEFAYVNVLSRIEKRKASNFHLPGSPSNGDGIVTRKSLKDARGRHKARRVDKVSRLAFPGVFVMFNVIYWITYFQWVPKVQRDLSHI